MMTFGSSAWSKPAVCEPGEAWQTRTSVPSSARSAALGRQPAQPVEPLVAERVVRPFGGGADSVSGTPSVIHGKAAA